MSCADGESLCCCPEGDCCKDLQNDPAHCGSCNAAPCAGTCSGGQCFCADATRSYCPGIGCVDLQSDEAHCGACNTPCRGVCIGGACTCRGDKVLCAEGCVDVTSDSAHCGQCGFVCADGETCVDGICCPDGHGTCWGECIDFRDDRRHCGACGHVCTTFQQCRDGVCQRAEPPADGCTAQSLRLWINAFYPGVVDGVTHERLIDGRLASVYLPLAQQRLANDQTEPLCSSTQACLRTDRAPDPRVRQDWTSFFSRDPAAPSMAHAEIEIDLRNRQAIREVVPQLEGQYGSLVHVEDADVMLAGTPPTAVAACLRPISPIPGSAHWFSRFDPDAIEGGLRFRLAATWRAWSDVDCTAAAGGAGECVMDQFAVCPLGSILGTIVVQVRPEDGVVRVSIPELEAPRFPVFEIYAALDDGHVVPVWVSEEPPLPLGQLGDVLPDIVTDISVDIPCGCGACDAGETTCENDAECISDSYFVLSSSPELRLNEEVLGQAPDAGIQADGPVTVTLNGLQRIFQGRDGTGTPPIGFRGKKGDQLRIEIACPGGAASCPGAQAGPLFLHRIDSLFGERPVQQFITSQVPLPLADIHQRKVIDLSRVTTPGGICMALDEAGGQVCIDILADPTQCGGLGDPEIFACGESETCLNGVCRCPIHMNRVGPRQCADLLNDDAHCGEPGNACDGTEFCANGVCISSGCGPGAMLCDGGCIDPNIDVRHCGSCGVTCPSAQLCRGGVCVCHPSLTMCPGVGCVDTSSDALHCGSCGNVCGIGEPCSGGICDCPSGTLDCGFCTDPLSDPSNCGSCGNACLMGEFCFEGQCFREELPIPDPVGPDFVEPEPIPVVIPDDFGEAP